MHEHFTVSRKSERRTKHDRANTYYHSSSYTPISLIVLMKYY
jgi:hypothetical protein